MKTKSLYCLVLIAGILLLAPVQLWAQRIEIIPMAGYHSSAKIKSIQGTFRVNDGITYGAEVNLGQNAYKISLSYSRMSSFLTYTEDDSPDPVSDLVVHFISLGGLLEFMQGDTIVPFFKVAIGSTYYQPLESDAVTENVLHFNLSGGTKFYLNEHFGFSLQSSFLMPVFMEGQYFEAALPPQTEGMKTKPAGIQGDFKAGVLLRF